MPIIAQVAGSGTAPGTSPVSETPSRSATGGRLVGPPTERNWSTSEADVALKSKDAVIQAGNTQVTVIPGNASNPKDGVALRRRNPRRAAPVRRKADAGGAEKHHRPSRKFRHAIAYCPGPRRSIDKSLDLIKRVSSHDTSKGLRIRAAKDLFPKINWRRGGRPGEERRRS